MTLSTLLGLIVGSSLLSACLVSALIRYAHRANMLDPLEARRLHTVPTARGGGMAIVLCVLAALLSAVPQRIDLLWPALALFAVAAIGWLDDRRGLSVRVRLLVHIAAAGMLAAHFGQFFPDNLFGLIAIMLVFGGTLLAINLTNFMDGANGLIGLPTAAFAVIVMIAASTLPAVYGEVAFHLSLIAATLFGATLGFLPFNFPRARVFLGDSGSGALGVIAVYLLAHLLLFAPAFLLLALALLLPYALDAGVTLIIRILRGQRFWEAHRQHLYQWLIRCGASHTAVSVSYLLVGCAGSVTLGWVMLHYGNFVLSALLGWMTLLTLIWVWTKNRLWNRRRRSPVA